MTETTSPPIVQLRDVALTLTSAAGAVNILRGISLSVAAGETVGIVGPSGSGKSSLMMVTAGLERASAGAVLVAGADLGALDEDALARFRRQTLGYVFQSYHLIPTLTAAENVAVPLEIVGAPDALGRARALLGDVGLGDRAHHYPVQLSGGEQQRVALARAFAVHPKLLLADEPTGNLDQDTGRQIIELLFDLRARHGTSLLLITHDPALAERCERIVRLSDGSVAEDRRTSTPRVAQT